MCYACRQDDNSDDGIDSEASLEEECDDEDDEEEEDDGDGDGEVDLDVYASQDEDDAGGIEVHEGAGAWKGVQGALFLGFFIHLLPMLS